MNFGDDSNPPDVDQLAQFAQMLERAAKTDAANQ